MILLRARLVVCAVGLVGTMINMARAEPIRSGFGIEAYATLPEGPQRLSFDDSSGTLYVGKANNNPQSPAFKVLPPNGSVEQFGNGTLFDPDVVLYDAAGAIAPMPGSVLVGGQPGYISAILPNGDVVSIFSSGSGFSNPNAMGFDSIGCLLFLDTPGGRILRTCSSAETPTLLFQPPEDATHMAINSSDWVYVGTRTGGLVASTSIYINCNGGTHLLVGGLDPAGAGPANHLPFALAPGEVAGKDVLYAISGTQLLSFEFDTSTCPPQLVNTNDLGAGFEGDFYNDMAFGPDGALYISHQNNGNPTIADGIIRVFNDCNATGINDSCDIDCGGTGSLCDLPSCGMSADCNTNGIPDECDLDFDGDGLIDDCDTDIDNDTVLNAADVCDFTPLGAANIILDPLSSLYGTIRRDLDGDCDCDLADHAIFVNEMTGSN